MAIQVNLRLSEEVVAKLDRWAAEDGVERLDLLRDMIDENLLARDEGRAAFDRSQPLGPGDLAAMKAVLAKGLMEIHRIATEWAKHLAAMRKQERDDQLALTQARAEFVAGIPERIMGSLNPIRAEMDALAERIAGIVDGVRDQLAAVLERVDNQPRLHGINATQKAHTAALEANTAAIEKLREEPRVHNSYDLGLGEWNGKAWAIVLAVLWVLSIALFFGLALLLPPGALAVRSANVLLGGGDQAVCRLVDYRFGTSTCKMRVSGREVGVSLSVPAPRKEHGR